MNEGSIAQELAERKRKHEKAGKRAKTGKAAQAIFSRLEPSCLYAGTSSHMRAQDAVSTENLRIVIGTCKHEKWSF
jgi:hypothetical protein